MKALAVRTAALALVFQLAAPPGVNAQSDPSRSVVFVANREVPAMQLATASPTTAAVEGADARSLLLVNTAVVGAGVAGVAAYGLTKWWDEGFTGSFHSVDEGWFGQDTRYGGADKAGHAYSAYVGVRLVSALLQSYGNDPEAAARIAFWATLGTMTAVEVADGFSKQYAFNYQDAVMNAVGAGFAWWLERNPELDELLDFRLYYRKSSESSSWDAFGDYSGQRYLLVAKASGVPQLRDIPIVRYLELAVGYGTQGYDGPPGTVPSRNVYAGLQLNVSAILSDTVFRDGRWPEARRAFEVALDFWQVPYTGVYADSRL